MQVYDLIMLGVLAGATLFGAWKGLAWQVASLASIFLSYFAACRFRDPVAGMIQAAPPWNKFLAMLIIFLGCSLAIWLAFRFVSDLIDRIKLKEFDRHAGAVLGFSRGVIWCVIITLFAVALLGNAQREAIVHSRSGHYIALLLDRAHTVMPEEIHGVLAPYIHSLDDGLSSAERISHPHSVTGQGGEATFQSDAGDDRFLPLKIDQQTQEQAQDAVQSWLQKLPVLESGDP